MTFDRESFVAGLSFGELAATLKRMQEENATAHAEQMAMIDQLLEQLEVKRG